MSVNTLCRWSGYACNSPVKSDGTKTIYARLVEGLESGPQSKTELLKNVLGRENRPGYLSHTFGAIAKMGWTEYDTKTKKLYLSPKGDEFIHSLRG